MVQVEELRAALARTEEELAVAKARLALLTKPSPGWQFPEAGPGRWQLDEIVRAFDAAVAEHGRLDLRRQPEPLVRCRLRNPKLAAALLARGHGQRVGGRSHDSKVRFLSTVVRGAAERLRSEEEG